MGGFEAVPATVCTVPAGHAPCGRQMLWFEVDEYKPGAQAEQVRSCCAEPFALTNVPGPQSVHDEQTEALAVALNVPLGQPAQRRS